MTFDPKDDNAVTAVILRRLDELEASRIEREKTAEEYRTEVRKTLAVLSQSVMELKLWRENLLGKIVGASFVASAIFAVLGWFFERH